MAVTEQSIRFAVKNIARYGDTDVFPFPLENHWFHDAEDDVVELLTNLDKDFDKWVATYPVQFVKSLLTVGYTGFRGSTQIDPIWNAYLLALVLEVAPAIESARMPTTKDIVFSYRFRPDKTENTLFDPDLGWGPYHQHALACSKAAHYIVVTDISDFYPRVYHHRLENALGLATDNSEVVRRIMDILTSLSSGTSYGLPIGGQAASSRNSY